MKPELLIAIATLVTAIAAAFASVWSVVTSKTTHKIVNSELDKWKEAMEKFYKAEGVLNGVAQEQARQSIRLEGVAEGKLEKVQTKP